MTTPIALSSLNPILARLMPFSFSPEKSALDCQGCARPGKCCDFQPFVANFLLGAWLEGGGDLNKFYNAEAISLQPLGMIAAASFRKRHLELAQESRGKYLTCTFFDRTQNQCSIWSYRPGECSTYLCSAENPGRTKLSEQSFKLETALAQMALAHLGYSHHHIARQIDHLNDPLEEMVSVKNAVEIYLESWNWVKTVKSADVAGWLEE